MRAVVTSLLLLFSHRCTSLAQKEIPKAPGHDQCLSYVNTWNDLRLSHLLRGGAYKWRGVLRRMDEHWRWVLQEEKGLWEFSNTPDR